MANKCKFEKTQYQVSYDSGITWSDVVPTQTRKGELLEYASPDCSVVSTIYRWRVLDGQYICDGNKKYVKEIKDESYDNGATWYTSYPTEYRNGQYVGVDSKFCCDKFVGHYMIDDPLNGNCPKYYRWNGYKCVYNDPLKVVKCDGTSTLTSGDTKYYQTGYTLVDAEIGDSITAIGAKGFYGCSGLTNIDMPSGLTVIGSYAFQHCSGLTSVEIPSTIQTISASAFSNCNALTSVTVNATTPPTLGSNAFDNTNNCPIYVPCESLLEYKYANNWYSYFSRIQGIPPCETTFMKFNAIYSDSTSYSAECDSSRELTTSATKPSGYQYTAMTSAEIGDCVTTIGSSGFSNCSSLSSVTIPDSVTSIGDRAFYGCSGLTSVNIPSGVTTLNNAAFAWCEGLTSITIPNSVQTMGYSVFSHCSGLTSATIGSGITNIGSYAFEYCESLQSITVNAITPPTLGTEPFRYTNDCPIYVPCESITSYYDSWSQYAYRIEPIPPCDIYTYKFKAQYSNSTSYSAECDSSRELTTSTTKPSGYVYSAMTKGEIGYCITSIGNWAFSEFTSLSSVTISNRISSIGNRAFYRCSALTSITIPNSVTNIGEVAFYGCTSLTNVTIPNTVTSLGGSAFQNCSGLTSVTIGNGLTTINGYTFYGCTSLSSVSISNGVTTIDDYAFATCRKRNMTIDIPSTVTTIGNCALGFGDPNSNVTQNRMYVRATTPPTLTTGKDAFWTSVTINGVKKYTLFLYIYVPRGSVDAYKNADGWSAYKDYITFIP